MTAFEALCRTLQAKPRQWTVTGAAGFIGSHIAEKLLQLGQTVIGLDNFSTGSQENLNAIKKSIGADGWKKFTFIKGDIRDATACAKAVAGSDYISHQAALASVPRSIDDPLSSTEVNVVGFVNIAVAARDAKVKQIVYASSSSVYGDAPELPKLEDNLGEALSPYALSKYADELYAGVFSKVYGLKFVGLRYFNVFGPRQSPNGPYAAVMPRWVDALISGKTCEMYGDGTTSRDFCFVDNAVQANMLGATTENPAAIGKAYNIAVGDRTSLNELYEVLAKALGTSLRRDFPSKPNYLPFRQGDIKHSLASIDRARSLLGYEPTVKLAAGIKSYVEWIVADQS